MSETNAPEPTMEEILASIRRIISEDDAPAPAAEAKPPHAEPHPHAHPHAAPAPHPPEPHAPHDDVLELTERVESEPAFAAHEPEPPPAPATPASLGDLDFGTAPTFDPAPAPVHEPAPAGSAGEEPLVGLGAAGRVADHFGALHSRVTMPSPNRTLEDVVRELLRPMLKDWLDAHLPAIVEARVQDEVERISRRRTY